MNESNLDNKPKAFQKESQGLKKQRYILEIIWIIYMLFTKKISEFMVLSFEFSI